MKAFLESHDNRTDAWDAAQRYALTITDMQLPQLVSVEKVTRGHYVLWLTSPSEPADASS